MKLAEAKSKIKNGLKKGFIIEFARVISSGGSVSERIPDLGENLFKTEDEAWDFAQKLADESTGEYVDFVVVDARFKAVPSAKRRKIQNY